MNQSMHNHCRPALQLCCQQMSCSCCFCQPQPVPFMFTKIDARTGSALTGAVFQLRDTSGNVQTEISDTLGRVTFCMQPGVSYTLTETAPPLGYRRNTMQYTVIADISCRVRVNGQYVENFTIADQPGGSSAFAFLKADSETSVPLLGAVFTLTQNGTIIATATSDNQGVVSFDGLASGAYSLTETTPPTGYMPNPAVHTVIIGVDGDVTVDGLPLPLFSVGNTAIILT